MCNRNSRNNGDNSRPMGAEQDTMSSKEALVRTMQASLASVGSGSNIVVVPIGCGYFAEMTASQAMKMLQRRLDNIKRSEKAAEVENSRPNTTSNGIEIEKESQGIVEDLDGEAPPLQIEKAIQSASGLSRQEVERRVAEAKERRLASAPLPGAEAAMDRLRRVAEQEEAELRANQAPLSGKGLKKGFFDRPATKGTSERTHDVSTDPAGPRDGPGPARAPATITHVRPRVSESAARPFPECGAVGDMDRRRAMLTGTSGAKPRPFKSFSALPHNPRRLLEPDHGILKHPGEPSHHHPARSGVSFNRKHCVVEAEKGAHLEVSRAARLGPTVEDISEEQEFLGEGGAMLEGERVDQRGSEEGEGRKGGRKSPPPPSSAGRLAQVVLSGGMSMRDLLRRGCILEEDEDEDGEEEGGEEGGRETGSSEGSDAQRRAKEAFSGVVVERGEPQGNGLTARGEKGTGNGSDGPSSGGAGGARVSRFRQQRMGADRGGG